MMGAGQGRMPDLNSTFATNLFNNETKEISSSMEMSFGANYATTFKIQIQIFLYA